MTALGAAGLGLPAFGAKSAYDPAARFAVKVSEVPFRRTPAGCELIARVYQPEGAGPFPVLLDLVKPLPRPLMSSRRFTDVWKIKGVNPSAFPF